MMGMEYHVAVFGPGIGGAAIGGAERIALHLARGLAEQGLVVDLVLVEPVRHETLLSELPPAVRVVGLKWPRRGLLCFPALARYLWREKPAALLSPLASANLVAIWARRLAGVSTHVTIREATTFSRHMQTMNPVSSRLQLALMRRFYPQADDIVAVSHGVARDMVLTMGLPLARLRVIYNPTVIPELFAKAREPVREPWLAAGQPPVILGVGRLGQEKDFATLMRAFAQVRQQRPARLIILGEGVERHRLEALVSDLHLKDQVALPGFVANPYAYMARAEVFVLSSVFEGLPNTLIEAMACETSVVSTDCQSGPREILEDGLYGRLTPVGDPQALAEAILATLDNPTDPEHLRRRADMFSLETVVGQYLEALNVPATAGSAVR